jgi:two-component system, response regulator
MHEQEIDLLLVEDSEDDTVFFREALVEAGIRARICVARDGAEAIQIIFGCGSRSERTWLTPKLIVLDLKMPKVSGAEVLRRLRADPRTREIPVVIFSSSQEKRDLAESYHLGANSYLVKPMEADEFGETVRLLGRYWLQFNKVTN